MKRIVIVIALLVATVALWRAGRPTSAEPIGRPNRVESSASDASRTQHLSMSDVLDMAQAARLKMAESLDDYTARLVKQEVDTSGVLTEKSEIELKVQSRLRGNSEQAPMRVYLKFTSPDSVKGREVLWGEDLYDGKMAVHELGMILGLKTIWLDPKGMIAMQGQRYPISEIGLVKLVEKLLERGERDRHNPDIQVTLTNDHQHDGIATQLIQVKRGKPSGDADDFSLAEIVIDPERQLILSYQSFGWPNQKQGESPLLESYTYYDVQTNVGLTDADFDTTNQQYGFPAF